MGVLSWGDPDFEQDDKNHIKINSLMDKLCRIFKKDEKTWDKDDKFLLQALSDMIRLVVTEERTRFETESFGLDKFHYVFVISSEWEIKITEKVFRSTFVKEGLITTDDSEGRLLFYTDIECICYHFQGAPNNARYSLKRGKNTLLCKLTPLENDTALVQFDLIYTASSLFNVSDSKLFPKVLRSSSFYVDQSNILSGIRSFLQDKLLGVESEVLKALVEDIYYNELPWLAEDNDVLTRAVITDTSYYKLNKSQIQLLTSIRIVDICQAIGLDFTDSMEYIISNNLVKEYNLISVDDKYSSDVEMNYYLIKWVEYMLDCSIFSLKVSTKVIRKDFDSDVIELQNIFSGAGYALMEVVQNSNMHCEPRVLNKNIDNSLSVFQNSSPNAIVSIDISLTSTLISYTLLDKNGVVEKIFDNNYFIVGKCLPSLGTFYSVSDSITLNVKKQFVEFAKKYSTGNLNFFSTASNKEGIQKEIENILNIIDTKETISINQGLYIKAFLLMYLIYVKLIISTKSPVQSKPGCASIRVGYLVSIEKILLENLVGTKDKFEELIYASTLVLKDDASKRLRIMTIEEKLPPVVQQSLKLKFPIRSNFVIAQLHETYIQLTLNHIVSTFVSEKEQQESIVIEDVTIHIRNIYDSFCLLMWENIISNRGLINLCEKHGAKDFDILQILTIKTKAEFTTNLKKYISENIFADNLTLQRLKKYTVQLSSSCHCYIRLTIDDIIHVCIKPVLEKITIITLTSLINKEIFGLHAEVDYIFSLVCFNKNTYLQKIIRNIMEEKAEYFCPKRGIETKFLVASKLPTQLLQLNLHQKPLFYEQFQVGTLHQVFNSDYIVSIKPENMNDIQYLCKNRISDIKCVKLGEDTAFGFFKKGNKIHSTGIHRVFYLKGQENIKDLDITITFDELDNSMPLDEAYSIRGYDTFIKVKDYNVVDGLPIMVSVIYQSHTSSLKFSVKIVGEDTKNIDTFIEQSELMTLGRF